MIQRCKISRTTSTKGHRCIPRFDVLLGVHYLNAQQNHQESLEEVGGKRNLRFNKVELKKKSPHLSVDSKFKPESTATLAVMRMTTLSKQV